MKRKCTIFSLISCGLGMVCLILDGKCAAQSVRDAIEICLMTIVPSLFPLFALAGVLVGILSKIRIPFIGQICNIPKGCESIFLLGLVGGYPMGAQCIVQAVEQKALSRKDAQRILGFCNNCGPAFIFGILGGSILDAADAAALLCIQAEAAFSIGAIWPGESAGAGTAPISKVSVPEAVSRAAKSMVSICSWVILAKVILNYFERWFFLFLPNTLQVLFTGLLELTSGCLRLSEVSNESQRFLLCCLFLSFGGIGVLLQIQGLVNPVGISVTTCAAQKMIQALIGCAIGCLYLRFSAVSLLIIPIGVVLSKKTVEKSDTLVYNGTSKGGIHNAFPKENQQVL